jgi:hypothetical protein
LRTQKKIPSNSGIPDSPRSEIESIFTLPTRTQPAGIEHLMLSKVFQSKMEIQWQAAETPHKGLPPPAHLVAKWIETGRRGRRSQFGQGYQIR